MEKEKKQVYEKCSIIWYQLTSLSLSSEHFFCSTTSYLNYTESGVDHFLIQYFYMLDTSHILNYLNIPRHGRMVLLIFPAQAKL